MIRAVDIQENLLHLIGWEQNYNTADLKITESLTRSDTGLFFQQVHPLLTLQNLASIAPDFKNVSYPEYSSETEYVKGNIVTAENGLLYKAVQDSTNIDVSNTDYWEETNPFSEWLESKTRASISKAILRYYNSKLTKGSTKSLCENKTLFDGTGRIVDTIQNKHNFVGFEIVPLRAKGITTKINKIGLQFTLPGDYTIYIFHSSCDTPIYVKQLTVVTGNKMEWFSFDDIYLPYESSQIDAGGSWYIGYFQSAIPSGSKAIRKIHDWSKGPCNSCSRREYASWIIWSKYIEVHPFYVNEELIDGAVFNENEPSEPQIHLWDIENNEYIYDTNFGINLDITVECDLTDFIISQKLLFQDVISKQVAIDFLREFAYNANVRTNRHAINASKLDILYELDGDSSSMKKSGLNYELELAIKALELSTEGIDRVCLVCVNHGIKYRAV